MMTGRGGEAFIMEVKVTGNPLPTVQWFKEGKSIDTSPDYIITFNNGVCAVQFDELVKGLDEGTYKCVAMNKVGQCETQVKLVVQGEGG